MLNIIFVCHGNICRSPTAEYYFKYLVKCAGTSDKFNICSRAVSKEALGCDIYPPAKEELQRNGIPFSKHCATQITLNEIVNADYILCMDRNNRIRLSYLFRDKLSHDKVQPLNVYAGSHDDIEDPWYTDAFDVAFNDIKSACDAFYSFLKKKGKI
ncbi:MAG: low molecular weight phosphotyrosine protein phosphatase [Bacilli bacterium]|nr:low molecular weight phosphotyrosine protein phosphatase [Bacilli bacterium]